MKMVFLPAIDEMNAEGKDFFGPISFQSYLEEHQIPPQGTAEKISVDSLDRIAPELRDHKVMVFRLGRDVGGTTSRFALARCRRTFDDFLIDDKHLRVSENPESFVPLCSFRDLFAFKLMPVLTESSLVNLALASGLLGSAISLDAPAQAIIPATGQSTFSFEVKPIRNSQVSWKHERGQVEIDAMFIARRGGRDVLFVVEAKVSDKLKSLAKHKLVYPILAIRPHVPASLPIVPIYLRIVKNAGLLNFYVTECRLGDDQSIEGFSPVGETKWLQLVVL